jgi:hypothetical protein
VISRPAREKLARPYLKNKIQTEWLGCDSVVDLLPSMHKSWIHSTTRKKEGKEERKKRKRCSPSGKDYLGSCYGPQYHREETHIISAREECFR